MMTAMSYSSMTIATKTFIYKTIIHLILTVSNLGDRVSKSPYIALQFDMQLDNIAAESPVKCQSNQTTLALNRERGFAIAQEKTSCRLVNWSPDCHKSVLSWQHSWYTQNVVALTSLKFEVFAFDYWNTNILQIKARTTSTTGRIHL